MVCCGEGNPTNFSVFTDRIRNKFLKLGCASANSGFSAQAPAGYSKKLRLWFYIFVNFVYSLNNMKTGKTFKIQHGNNAVIAYLIYLFGSILLFVLFQTSD